MREIDELAVAHGEHEGLLTVEPSWRAHGGCRAVARKRGRGNVPDAQALSAKLWLAEQGPHGRGQGAPSLGKEYPQCRQYRYLSPGSFGAIIKTIDRYYIYIINK